MQTQQESSWELSYLDALLADDAPSIAQYETLDYFMSVSAGRTGVRELLLYRLTSRLETTDEIVQLLSTLQGSEWEHFGPRVLARIADTDELVRNNPELATLCERIYEDRTGATNYSMGNWQLIGYPERLRRPNAPKWSRRVTSLSSILNRKKHDKLSATDIRAVVEHFHDSGTRIYSLAIITFYELSTEWAETLHRVLAVPHMNVVAAPTSRRDEVEVKAPLSTWSPQWQVRMDPEGWNVKEAHTGAVLQGIGASSVHDVMTVLLSLGGFLRDGIMSNPTNQTFVKALTISQPIWGFRDKQYAADGTPYRAVDIRALALGFLEGLPASKRVRTFRSRLAMNLVGLSWDRRRSVSVVTPKDSLYKDLIRVAQLFAACEFEGVLQFVEDSPHQMEPALQNLASESRSALAMLAEVREAPGTIPPLDLENPSGILCVTHASIPQQNGGYAIRAHGILSQLRQHGVDISAVTRPGFPEGALTRETVETIDGVNYLRLPATAVSRVQGEMQHMESYIEVFEELFSRKQVGKIHVRSTFLIALPALIAARRLGLPVLYEVSGLWELVYRDREHESHLLKRSAFAELAETVTMQNVDRLVVMNDAVRRIAVDRGVDSRRIEIAPNAVNVDRFKPLAPPGSEVFTVGYLGSFVDYEGLDVLLDAVKLLRDCERPMRFVMVGDGSKFASIRARVRNENLEDHVHLTGRIPHQEVLAMYEQMDALVYPRASTNATEAITPLKPFEALAMEKPIVVSDVQPLQEIVGNGERGLSFRAGDAQGLANAIVHLATDPALAEKLGRNGRQWVIENRNWETVTDRFIYSYAQMEA